MVDEVDGLFALDDGLRLVLVALEEALQRGMQVGAADVREAHDLLMRLRDHDGRALGDVVRAVQQLAGIELVLRRIGHELFRHVRHRFDEREHQNGAGRIVDRMEVRDLPADVVRRQALDEGDDGREDQHEDAEQDRAQDLDRGLGRGCPLAQAVAGQGRDDQRRYGADVHAHDHVDDFLEAHRSAETARDDDLQDTDGRRGALDDQGEQRAEQHGQDGIVHVVQE